MVMDSFAIDYYEVHLVSPNNSEFPDVYGFIHLYWQDNHKATLCFYRDNVDKIPANSLSSFSGDMKYNVIFGQAAFHDIVDLLRNESVFFQWDDASKAAMISTGREPVGEAEEAYE